MKIVIALLLCAAATVAAAENYGAPITLQGAASVESAIESLRAEAAADVLIEGKIVRAQERLTNAGAQYVLVATGIDVKTYPKHR